MPLSGSTISHYCSTMAPDKSHVLYPMKIWSHLAFSQSSHITSLSTKLGILFPLPVSVAPQLELELTLQHLLVEIHANISSVTYGKNKTWISLDWMKSTPDTASRLLLLSDFSYQHHGTVMEILERMTRGFWGIGIEAQEQVDFALHGWCCQRRSVWHLDWNCLNKHEGFWGEGESTNEILLSGKSVTVFYHSCFMTAFFSIFQISWWLR